MLRRLLLATGLSVGLSVGLGLVLGTAAASAQDAGQAIREVISSQIEAFGADDVDTAFGFASPGIRRLFGSPERFGDMVRSGYPMVWRPGSLRFAELREEDGRTVQVVLIVDGSGTLHVLDYEMVQGEGGWLIDGVSFRRGDLGA
jgi:hypothetical protein